jgi:hypothetical protein
VLLPHARRFSQPLHSYGLQATEASTVHLHTRWLYLLLFQQNRGSPALLSWYTSCTVRTFADLRKCEKSWHNLSTSSPSMGSLHSYLSSNSSQLWLLSSLPLSLSVLRSPPVQCLDNTVQCAPPYDICSIPEYPSNWCGDLYAFVLFYSYCIHSN